MRYRRLDCESSIIDGKDAGDVQQMTFNLVYLQQSILLAISLFVGVAQCGTYKMGFLYMPLAREGDRSNTLMDDVSMLFCWALG